MEQSVKINIAGYEYKLTVTSPDHEEIIRKAAAELNTKLAAYQKKFPKKMLVEVISFVALNVCMTNYYLQRQIKGMEKAELDLTEELKGYLEKIDKDSR